MCRMRPCLTAAGFIAGMSLLFLLAGMFVPLWSHTDDGTTRSFGGLWFSVFCPSTGCVAIPFNTDDNINAYGYGIDSKWGWINRACLLVGVVITLIGTLIVNSYWCVRERSKGCHIVACVLLWIAGLETVGCVLSQSPFFIVAMTLAAYANAAFFPWSYMFCGLGGLFALIAAICLVAALCNWRQYDEYHGDRYGQDDRQIPTKEQNQRWDKQGHTNAGYHRPERAQELKENIGKKTPIEESDTRDRLQYGWVARPPPHTQNEHGSHNMYRPYNQNQRY